LPDSDWSNTLTNNPTTLEEAVAAAIWRVYVASPIVTDGSAGLTWDNLSSLAAKYPGRAPAVIRATALAEASAAIEVVNHGR
jgi:hypothetical protein